MLILLYIYKYIAAILKRKLMKHHINEKCPLTLFKCDECKDDVLRKDMDNHILNDCPEHEIECEYKEIGCNTKVKRKLMNEHMKQKENSHLRLTVGLLKNEIVSLKKEMNEMKSVIEQNKISSLQNELRNRNELYVITKAKKLYEINMYSKKIQPKLASDINASHYCLANNVNFADAINMGFPRSVFNVMSSNHIIFGTNENRVTCIHVNIKFRVRYEVKVHS